VPFFWPVCQYCPTKTAARRKRIGPLSGIRYIPSRMRVPIRVTPRAKRPAVEVADDGALVVKVREPAEDGRANAAVIEALAGHFGVSKRAVTIVHGLTSRRKLVEVCQ
jgi:uncharacterized protein (TIGR00251 family)